MVDNRTIGTRLRLARRAIGLTQTEAGNRLGMVASTISAIEAGKRNVSGLELYQLARIYKRPLAFLLGDEPPTESPGFQYLFRQADERILDRASIVHLEQLAADYQLLEDLVGAAPLPLPPDYSSFNLHTVEDAETLAEMERSRLSLGDAPIRDLPNLLDEQVGVRTFMLPVANQSWSGLAVRDQSGRPCIAINSKEECYRRNYDSAHEYGHVLVHLGRNRRPDALVDFGEEPGRTTTPEERFAEAFAASFLMPRRGVLDQLERTLRTHRGQFTDQDLVHLAMHFGVSGQALSLRLVALRKLPRATHEEYWKKRARTFKALADVLGYAVEQRNNAWDKLVLPRRFRYLALTAYRREIISVSKLAELLRGDVFELRAQVEAAGQVAHEITDAS